jgi:hypothetical protein
MKTKLVLPLLLVGIVSAGLYAGRGRNRPPAPAPVLTQEVADHLLFLREEEKLARDVYLVFLEAHLAPVFDNISSSEQKHMDSVKKLLDTYGLDDPAAGLDEGEFQNDDIAGLYDSLVADGESSLEDALYVGAYIEEYDILDIMAILAIEDLPADVKNVCENLLSGSYSHLRAFVGQLESLTGETYEPVLMPAGLYETIIGGGSGRRGGR